MELDVQMFLFDAAVVPSIIYSIVPSKLAEATATSRVYCSGYSHGSQSFCLVQEVVANVRSCAASSKQQVYAHNPPTAALNLKRKYDPSLITPHFCGVRVGDYGILSTVITGIKRSVQPYGTMQNLTHCL
jgi:hypothetical protein